MGMKVPHVKEDKLYNEVLSLLKIFDLIICSLEGLLDNIIEKSVQSWCAGNLRASSGV